MPISRNSKLAKGIGWAIGIVFGLITFFVLLAMLVIVIKGTIYLLHWKV